MSLAVELVSPERVLWSGEAEMVITRTIGGGDIAFLDGHAPFVGALGIGVLTVTPSDGPDEHIAVHGGFVEVSDNTVTILSDVAELRDHIDEARAQKSKEEAEAALRDNHDTEAQSKLRRAETRLEVRART